MPNGTLFNGSNFESYFGDEIGEKFFNSVSPVSLHNGEVKVYDETETVFRAYSNALVDIKDSEDEFWGTAKASFTIEYVVFISPDGEKLASIANNRVFGMPKSNQVFIFIESDDDTLSDRVVRLKLGDKVAASEFALKTAIGLRYPISDDELKLLLSSLKESPDTTFKRVTSKIWG